LTKPEGWKALGYLFVGMLSSIGFFVATLAGGAITLGLSFIGVGLLLVGPWFAMVTAFANAERAMAGWVGYEIPPRDRKAAGALGWRSITDPERWRMVAYVGANVIIAPILFALGSFCYSLVVRVAGGWGSLFFDFFPFNALAGILMLVIAIVALGAAPRVVLWVAAFKANVTAWFLGPDKLALAEQRVTVLSTQRQDILDAVASERRRIERNLHDGVQQQLVAIGLDLGMAERQLERDPDRARELVVQAREKVRGSIGELRQLGRGLHPAILEDRGIDAALSAIVSSAPIPVSVQVDDDLDLDTDVAETVYFIANEAIANVLKHAEARVASIHVSRVAANVRVLVHDDGRGGADAGRGTGLAGIRARVNAVDGSMSISSPSGGPTTVVAELPRHVHRTGEDDAGAVSERVVSDG
jgi:signal transduction histidine kinase